MKAGEKELKIFCPSIDPRQAVLPGGKSAPNCFGDFRIIRRAAFWLLSGVRPLLRC